MNTSAQFKNFLEKHSGFSKASVKNYVVDLNHFISWFEKTKGTAFNPTLVNLEDLTKFREEKSSTLSEASLKRHLSSLKKYFHYLKMEGLISQSPLDDQSTRLGADQDVFRLKDFKNFLYVYNASPLTIKNYVIDVKQFLSWLSEIHPNERSSADLLLGKANSELIEEYKTRLMANANFSPSSVNRKLSSLRRYFSWANEQGIIKHYVQAEPTKRVISVPKQPVKTIPEAQPKPGRLSKIFSLPIGAFDQAVTVPLAYAAQKARMTMWKVKGKPVFNYSQKDITPKIPLLKTHVLKISNVKKEFYAPSKMSIHGLPWHKQVAFHVRHTRPNWYRKHQNAPLAIYFQYAVLAIIIGSLAVGFYTAFVKKPLNQKGALAAPTAPPRILSFQGRLTDNSDNPITSTQYVRFGIYADPTATGAGNLLWQEVDTVSPDTDGIFSILLGDGSSCSGQPLTIQESPCSIPASVFTDNSTLYLGVSIGTSAELTPRQRVATVAFATNSESLQGLVPTTQAGLTSFTNTVLALDSTVGSPTLTIGGSVGATFQATGGEFVLSGKPLTLTTQSNGNITLNPNGLGKIDLQKPLQNNTGTGNVSTVPGAVEVNDEFAVLATSSGRSAVTINQDGGGPLISASASGTEKFTVSNSGDITLAGTTITSSSLSTLTTGATLGVSATTLNLGGGSAATIGTISNDSLSIVPNGLGDLNLATTNTGNVAIGNGTGTVALTLGSDATGDIYYRNSGGTLSRLPITAAGSVLTSTGTIPSWATSSGTGAIGYWTRTGTTLSPTNAGDSLSVAPTATTGNAISFSDTVLTPAGGASANLLNLAFTNAATNGSGTSVTTGLNIAPTNSSAGAGGAMETYGIKIADVAGTSGAGTQTNYGLRIGNQGLSVPEFSYGLYVDAQSGAATQDYSAIFAGGNVGIGDTTPTSLFTVGSGDLFQVNSSGAIAAATGITSSGTINFSGLTASRAIFTDASKNLVSSAVSSVLSDSLTDETGTGGVAVFNNSPSIGSPTLTGTINASGLTASRFVLTDASKNLVSSGTSSNLSDTLTDETGTGGVAVFNTSPSITTSLTTGSTSFDLINTTATTVNFAGAATTLNLGAPAGSASTSATLTLGGSSGTIRPGYGPLNLAYKSGANAWATGLTLQDTTGNVGIGTTSPDSLFDINLGTSSNLQLTYNDSNGSATTYSRFGIDSSGNLTIDNTGTKTVIADDLQVTGNDILSSSATALTLSGSDVTVAGDLTITGTDITNTALNFGGGSAATIGTVSNDDLSIIPNGLGNLNLGTTNTGIVSIGNTTGDITLGSDTITASSLATFTTAATLAFSGDITITGNDITNTTLNFGNGSAATLGTTSNANLSLSPNGTGDIRLVNDADTDIIAPNFTNNGGVLYANGSGVLGQTTVGSNGECLKSIGGGTPTWGVCGGNSSPFQELGGAIVPMNSTEDLLVGGQATTSAKFAFINVNSGNPTASISGNLAISAPTTAGANTFDLLNNSSLNFRVSEGGNAGLTTALFIDTKGNSGNVGIGNAAPNAKLDVNGTASVSGTLTLGNGSSNVLRSPYGPLTLQYKSGANAWSDAVTIQDTTGNIGIAGVTNPADFKLQVAGHVGPNVDATYDLGSALKQWRNVYAQTITVGTLVAGSSSIAGTISDTFTINTDNATADGEDATLSFERGSTTPNAAITWTSASDRFDFNSGINISSTIGSTTAIGVGAGFTNILDSATLDISGAGAISGATGIASSGTINFTGLTSSRFVLTDGSSNLTTTGSSANLASTLSDEEGTGKVVFNDSPTINTALNTSSSTFALVNVNATTVNFAGGATTALNLGSSTASTVNLPSLTASRFVLTDASKNLISSGASSILASTLTDETGSSGGVAVFSNAPSIASPTLSGTVNVSGLSASSGVYTDGSKNLTSTAPTSGTIGYWTRSGTTVSPATNTDTVAVGSSNQLTINSSGTLSTSGNISTTGTGTITSAGTLTASNGFTVTTGAVNITGTSGSIALTGFGTTSITSTTATGNVNSLIDNSLTTGTLQYLSSTATGLTTGGLFAADWSPGSATTATGDLFSLNIGANGVIGNILNVKDNSSSVFSVSQTAVTANLPTSFNAAGDVSMAYDLNFTNPTASYIKSAAPLYITSGETFNSSDLTLGTYNKGNIIANTEAFVVNGSATVSASFAAVAASTAKLADLSFTNASVNTSGTSTTTGLNIAATNNAVGSGGTMETYGINIAAVAGTTGAGTQNIYGIRIGNQGLSNAENSYGLYVDAQSGSATSNYAAIFAGGNVGIGTTSPAAKLDVSTTTTTYNSEVGFIRATLSSDTTKRLYLGWDNAVDTNGAGYIQSVQSGTAYRSLLLNPAGGNVGIGTTAPGAKLEVDADTTYAKTAIGRRNTWGAGVTYYPTIYSVGSADEWIMFSNPHIPYLVNGTAGFTGTTAGARVRFADSAAATGYWDVGVPSYGTGTNFSIGRNASVVMSIDANGRHDSISNSGNGGYISSGNYGGTGTAAYFPSGLWSNGSNAWIYGTVNVNGNIVDVDSDLVLNDTVQIAGNLSCLAGYCPSNNVLRMTPNFHLNAYNGYAVILNWDNGTTGTTQTLRVGNGASADAWYVRADGLSNQTSSIQIDGNTVIDDGGGWHRAYGQTGFYNGTYGGGIWMQQSGYVEVYGSNRFRVDLASIQGNANTKYACIKNSSATVPGEIAYDTSCNPSIRALKKNIIDATFGLKDALALHPVEFDWRSDNTHGFGFIAEDVLAVNPLFVTYDQGKLSGVEYITMVSLAIKAIQEQQVMINDSQTKVASMGADLSLTDSGNLSIVNNDPENFPNEYTVVKSDGTAVTRVSTFAEAVAAKARVGLIEAKQITTDSLSIATDQVTVAGKQLSQYISDIVDQKLAGQQPAGTIAKTDSISPSSSSDSAKLAIKLNDNAGESKLEVQNASGSAVASIDSTGRLTADQIVAKQLTLEHGLSVLGDATISGVLRAQKIIADQIEGLSISTASISATYITNNYYGATGSAVASPSGEFNASNSASLISGGAIFENGVMAFGPSSLSDLTLTGQLAVGSQLVLADHSMNVLGGNLEIQSLQQGNVSFEGDLVSIDTQGNLTVKGNANFAKDVSIQGLLTANEIAPFYNKDLVIKLGGESATESGKFVIKNSSGSAVLSIDSKGNLTASGAAYFAKLNLDASVASPSSSTQAVATGSAGLAVIKAGQIRVTINNPLVKTDSLIYVTPKADTIFSGQPYIEQQVSGDSFTVRINRSISADMPFNWVIIN